MRKIPVAFCFDDNLEIPAVVCLTSLLENAHENTFYDIFILHADGAKFPHGVLNKIPDKYPNCKITFRSVGNEFKQSFEIRGITHAAYYRLLIPDLIPEYDKVMYHDVDVIFRDDLADMFENTNIENHYIAGVVSPDCLDKKIYKERINLGLNPFDYIQSGNLIFNSLKLREDKIVERFKSEAMDKKYIYQDQDIINIVCKNYIVKIPPYFCATVWVFNLASHWMEQPFYTQAELKLAQNKGIIHYNGAKPWNEYCPNFDIWWQYYRNSICFDHKWYFDFYYSKLDDLDRLSLWKRVKILLRYFKTRKK